MSLVLLIFSVKICVCDMFFSDVRAGAYACFCVCVSIYFHVFVLGMIRVLFACVFCLRICLCVCAHISDRYVVHMSVCLSIHVTLIVYMRAFL